MNNFGEQNKALQSQKLIEAEFLQNQQKVNPKNRDRLILGWIVSLSFH